MKKTVALVLSLILIVSCLTVPAFASDSGNTVIQKNEIEEKVEQTFAGFLGKPNAKITVDSRLVDLFKRGKIFGIKAGKLADELSDYVLVKASALDARTASAYGAYTVVVLDSGVRTVYIAVNIAEHPELYRLDCFHDAVTELVAGEKAAVAGQEATLMDYNRVAGELALHMIVYGMTAPLVRLQGEYTPAAVRSLYDQSKIADLNITENRVPNSLMELVGGISNFLYQITFGLFR